jgi:hypothetical protein
MKPSPNVNDAPSTRSIPVAWTSHARATVSGRSSRTPSTSPMHAAYRRASARALPIPFDDGSSAARSARVFHSSS